MTGSSAVFPGSWSSSLFGFDRYPVGNALARTKPSYGGGKVSVGIDQERAYAQLHELKNLAVGWDGDDAPSIDERIIRYAESTLRDLLASAPAPDVVPNVNGTISFEWDQESGYAHLELGLASYSFLLMRSGQRRIAIKAGLPAPSWIGATVAQQLFGETVSASSLEIQFAAA